MRWKRVRRREEIPSASLADMAFLLLIFFIATTTFAIEHGLPLVLPSARRSAVLSLRPEDVFRIEIRANGTIVVNDRAMRLEEIASQLKADNAVRHTGRREELVVVIETAPGAPYERMIGVLDAVREANARRVALKQLEGGPTP